MCIKLGEFMSFYVGEGVGCFSESLPLQGIECEYRHSEIARLNPRDCWYWLAGSCLNPSCGFRHPVSSYYLWIVMFSLNLGCALQD